MRYELTKLTGPLLKLSEISAAATSWMAGADVGRVLGLWHSEIGELGAVLILRSFASCEELAAERQRCHRSANPFNGAGLVRSLQQESYRGFDFLPDIEPRVYGGLYEFRTYWLKPGGLPPTLTAWRAALEPAKAYTEHLVINMIALDGPPRITHIWGFESIQQRFDLRAEHYAAGLWPPKGAPEQIEQATSMIALASEHSPLR
ncbi:NIPSNAP family protein [uncultured Pseudomonas sp.]|uniref:NIPSNAP family protein n=1 Tax=uncultured Pseudomonas sp. TaxID=114707 RepID=UPI0025833D1B|nr:NIPSNAP family protein [uncultured Pseudomonas sp.]